MFQVWAIFGAKIIPKKAHFCEENAQINDREIANTFTERHLRTGEIYEFKKNFANAYLWEGNPEIDYGELEIPLKFYQDINQTSL